MAKYGNIEATFEWDPEKERENQKKHGLSFLEAIEAFFDPYGFQLKDRKHSNGEKRYYWVGKDSIGRVITIYYTFRGSAVRIIGAACWRKFRRLYDERTKND